MNGKTQLMMMYSLVGLVGVIFVEFQNLFILEMPLGHVLKNNLPFVLVQLSIFILISYFYTIKNLGFIFQLRISELTEQERREYFQRLTLFPFRLFKFSIVVTLLMLVCFHLYEIILAEKLTRDFFISMFFSQLREMALSMIIALLVVASVKRFLRPILLQFHIEKIEQVYLPLSRKIYFIFFSLLFIFLTDIVWLVLSDESVEKVFVIVGVLSLIAIFTIKFTVLDSISYSEQIVKQISNSKVLTGSIPVTSADEISFLIGGFNELQSKVRDLYKEIDDDLELALTVQQNLLPKQTKVIGDYSFEGISVPIKTVGGDFFDLLPIGEKKMAVLIGDVSGKGMPAALLMSVMLGMIRGKLPECSSPARLLMEINKVLLSLLPEGMYITAGLGVIDVEEGSFTYASAGHIPPLIRKNGRLSYLETSSLPLGIDGEEKFEELVLPMVDVDGVILYTDGMIEQMNRQKKMFGFNQFLSLCEHNWDKGMKELFAEVSAFSQQDKYIDDRTMVLMRRNRL